MEEFHHQTDWQLKTQKHEPIRTETKIYREAPTFILKEIEFNSEGTEDKELRREERPVG